jgi:hypothetical protein
MSIKGHKLCSRSWHADEIAVILEPIVGDQSRHPEVAVLPDEFPILWLPSYLGLKQLLLLEDRLREIRVFEIGVGIEVEKAEARGRILCGQCAQEAEGNASVGVLALN